MELLTNKDFIIIKPSCLDIHVLVSLATTVDFLEAKGYLTIN